MRKYFKKNVLSSDIVLFFYLSVQTNSEQLGEIRKQTKTSQTEAQGDIG